MKKFGKGVVRCRVLILILSVVLLVPAAIGYFNTRVNYDILSYLPDEIETMKGQEILKDDFGIGAFSLCVVQGMENKEVSALESRIAEIPHVKKVIWYDTIADLSLPMAVLPDDIYNIFNNDETDSTMLAVLYDTGMSEDETMDAIKEIRGLASEKCFISGMSAVITDIKELSDREVPIYVVIAVVLAIVVLSLTMDSAIVPLFFLLSIGMAIIYNLGTNMVKGEISYVTQALAAVLQLGVTMDYSIFLWHSYEEECAHTSDHKDAMASAIANTITSVVGSSITTVAGFVALCFMSFTLGLDLGVVMAKGVVFGVIGCVTILPSMILVFDKAVQKTKHRPIIPDLGGIAGWITGHYKWFVAVFLIMLAPAIYGYTHTDVYYDLAGTLPKDLPSIVANDKLEENFEMNATHLYLIDSGLSAKDVASLIDEVDAVDGVKATIGLESVIGAGFPKEMLPADLLEVVQNDEYELLMVSSAYAIASDEVNAQCDKLDAILDKYDTKGMLIGEAPCTKDLINITNEDFKRVSAVSILAIFAIILLVFKSITLPIILVAVIEFAIFINMGIPAYTGTVLPFIASIVIGTIQLGATVDYAILMTNKYKNARYSGYEKKEAVTMALQGSIQSVIVSALSFFSATFGVGLYSNIDMISSLCILMSRGAIISMFVVIFILPSMFLIFDKVIVKTSIGFKNKNAGAADSGQRNIPRQA